MTKDSRTTIGVDVGDRRSHFCVLDEAGEVVDRGDFRTTPAGLKRMLDGRGDGGTAVAFETGSHALWIRRHGEAAGCEAIEGNPRQVRLIYGGHTKNDRLDAENLARLARVDAGLLKPVRARRGEAVRDADREVLGQDPAEARGRAAPGGAPRDAGSGAGDDRGPEPPNPGLRPSDSER